MREPESFDPSHPEGDGAIGAALSDCRATLERSLNGLNGDSPRNAAMDAARLHLGRFAAITAEHEVPPERVVVMLKQSVRDLSATRRWINTEREALSHELVEMTVEAYYGSDGNGDGRQPKR